VASTDDHDLKFTDILRNEFRRTGDDACLHAAAIKLRMV